jgi:hypothetical protein
MKTMGNLYLVFLFNIFFVAGCSEQTGWVYTIENKKTLDSIPSGSGIVINNDTAYIIGDDATGVYKLSLSNYSQQKISISGLSYSEYRESKSVKHDFESATFVNREQNEYLLAFGSGGDLHRDSMMMLNTSDLTDDKIISIERFYKRLRALTGTDSTQWNIEGATIANDELILFNRGNNLIITIKLNSFLSHVLETDTEFPPVEYHTIKLPSINNHEARLSGACTLDDSHILFSASVEDTPDWTTDGPVLGSFIGIYSLNDDKVISSYLLKDKDGQPLKEKIESLDIRSKEANSYTVIVIGDNDIGTTNLFILKLRKGD